jgi:hypothetical protein
MTPKATNTVYWICTIIFAALMVFSAAGGIKPSQQAIQVIHDGLGYPVYFIQFISIAKLLGVYCNFNTRFKPGKRMGLCRPVF